MASRARADQTFWDRADAVIHLANAQCETVGSGKVSASLLYAAARFNAFVVFSQSSGAEQLEERKSEALDYFTGEFRKMLEENLDDHISQFSAYSSQAPTDV